MILRYWIADLISGGELNAAQAEIASMADAFERHVKAQLDAQMVDSYVLAKRYGNALIAIAEMETPKASSKVKRMARVAREALK